jgi:hypothetical protein
MRNCDYIRSVVHNSQLFLFLKNYRMPSSAAYRFNMPILDLLVKKSHPPEVYVPKGLWVRDGPEIHLDFRTEPSMRSKGWKKICMDLVDWNPATYSDASIFNAIDSFFANYPRDSLRVF